VASSKIHRLSLSYHYYTDEDTDQYRSALLDLSFWVIERKTTLCAARLTEELKPLIQEWKLFCPLLLADQHGHGKGTSRNEKDAPFFESSPGHFLRTAESLLYSLCQRYEVQAQQVLTAAIRTMDYPGRNLTLCSLLVHMLDRPSTLNILIRMAVRKVLHRCALASKSLLGYEMLTQDGRAVPQELRDELVQFVWELEMCLFFHLEGSLKLSRKTILEMTVGARVALLLVSWRVNYPALQLLISHPPHTNLVAEGTAQSLEEEEPPQIVGGEGSQGRQTPCIPTRSFSDDLDDGTEENESAADLEEVDPLTDLAATVAHISHAEAYKETKRPTHRRRRSSNPTAEGDASEAQSRCRAVSNSTTGEATEEEKTGHTRRVSNPLPASSGTSLVDEKHRRQQTMPHLSNVVDSLAGGEQEKPPKQTPDGKATARSKKHKFVSTPDFERLRSLVGGSQEQFHVSVP